MKQYFTILLFLLLTSAARAQDISSFGQVNAVDFTRVVPEDQPATVLKDWGRTSFLTNNEIMIRFEREMRTMIHTKPGLSYAEVAIPFYQDGFGKTEQIVEIKAFTYNIDPASGELIKKALNAADIYEEEINAYWHVKKFAFPDVREGSIIEYRYVIHTPFLFNPPDWEFQRSIPVVESTYEIWLIPFYEYTYLLQGADKFTSYKTFRSSQSDAFAGISFNYMVHRFTMKNVPPFEDETFITSKDDYIMKLDFQLAKINYPTGGSREIMTTWPKINDEFLKSDNFGRYLKQASKYAQEYLQETGINISDKTQRLEDLIVRVRSDFDWNGTVDKFANNKVKDVFDDRQGSSAELNLFLCAVLREAGFTANPVLISTRDHGKVHPDHPFSNYFNDVVCFVEFDGKSILADATESWLPYNDLPVRCLNGSGLIVEEKSERWVALETSAGAFEHHYLEIDVSPESATADVTAVHRLDGYAGYSARKTIFNDQNRLTNSKLAADFQSIRDIQFEGENEPAKPYVVRFGGTILLEGYDDKLLVQPFLDLLPKETPLKARERRYPVDMIYRRHNQIVTKIKIPDGYEVLEKPDPVSINDHLVSLSLLRDESVGYIELKLNIEFKSALYEPDTYQRLRELYLIIVNKLNQPVVLIQQTEP